MPMQWNAENDRLLLLKLIETHGISINADKIAKAWPAEAANKPTARAVSERFVKIRQLAGVTSTPTKASGGATRAKMTSATPAVGRMSLQSSGGSAAKKRKVAPKRKIVDSDEESAQESDTPPPTRSTRKAAVFQGKGRTLGDADVEAFVKSEPMPDPFNISTAVLTPGISTKAKNARNNNGHLSPPTLANSPSGLGISSDTPFTDYMNANNYPMSSNIGSRGNMNGNGYNGFVPSTPMHGTFTFQDIGAGGMGSNGNGMASNGNGMSPNIGSSTSTFNPQTPTPTRLASSIPLPAAPTPHSNTLNNNPFSHSRSLTPISYTTNPPARQRTPRKASQQAVSNIQAWTHNDREVGKEFGERESEEGESGSAFEEDEI